MDSAWEQKKLEARKTPGMPQTPTRQVVGSRDDAWNISNGKRHDLILVFIPCHIEPDMRFALIRLSDNLRPAVFKARPRIFQFGRRIPVRVE